MLNRFSIRTRLAANAVVACFFLALVVAVSAFGLTAGRNGLQDMTERYYPCVWRTRKCLNTCSRHG